MEEVFQHSPATSWCKFYQILLLLGFKKHETIKCSNFVTNSSTANSTELYSSTDCCTRRIFSYSDYNGIQIIMGFLRPNHSNQMCDFSAIWRAESMESSTTFFAAFLASYLAVTIFILNRHWANTNYLHPKVNILLYQVVLNIF